MTLRRAALLLLALLVPRAVDAAYPPPTEADWIARDVRFTSGETLAAVKLHYRTLGSPQRDAAGRVRNAVLILHGTGGSGAQCDNDPQTFALAECNVFAGFACDGATCATLNWSDLNGTCNDTTACRDGYCNAGTCAPLPTTGMSCAMTGACGEDAFCDGTNCRPLIIDGQQCNRSAECAGESLCLMAGVNRPGTCGTLEWQLCQ